MNRDTMLVSRSTYRLLQAIAVILGVAFGFLVGDFTYALWLSPNGNSLLWRGLHVVEQPTTCTPSPAITVDADGTIVGVEPGVAMEERK